DLANLSAESLQVNVDLRNEAFSPEKTISLRPRQVTHAGSNSRITSIQPDTIRLQLGKEGKKQIPVIVSQTGQPPEGFKVEAVVIEPQLATLVGAEDLLQGVNALQTAPLNLSDKIQSFEQRLEVLPPNPEWVGEVDPPRVLVRVTLAGLTVERKFSDIPLLLTHPADQPASPPQTVEPRTVDVFLKGSPQTLDTLEIRKIQAFVSSENLEDRKSDLRKVNVLVPAGLEVLGIQPDQVKLRLLPAPTPVPTPTPSPVPAPAGGVPAQPEPLSTSES
ncbi:MAG: YbbR-like domain-containing protein, partial [Kiritimatiellia bacterium]